jgi:dihydropteroate synthase
LYAAATYRDVMGEIAAELGERVAVAERAGVLRDRIVVDPGLGFAKRAAHTIEALARLDELAALGLPILSGPSRKSFLKDALGDVPPAERVWGTAAAVAASILHGAHIVRVHDVGPMVQVARVCDRLLRP